LKAVPDNHRAALELMMLTGLSPHEAERLQVRDFHPTVAGVGVSLGVGQRPDFRVKTPSRKRWIPLNKRARELWVIVTAGKRPLDPALPSSCAMQKALARARTADPKAPDDARRITPKLMRQWFASHRRRRAREGAAAAAGSLAWLEDYPQALRPVDRSGDGRRR
jgi:integrase